MPSALDFYLFQGNLKLQVGDLKYSNGRQKCDNKKLRKEIIKKICIIHLSKCFRWIFWHIYIHWIIAFQWFSLNRHQSALRIRISRPQRFLLNSTSFKQFQAVQKLMSTLLIVVTKINKISRTIITLRKKIPKKDE